MALRLRLCVLLVVLVWAQETSLRHEPKVRRAFLSRPSGRGRPRKRAGKGGFIPNIPKPVDPVTNVRPGSSGGRPDSGVMYGSGNGPQGVPKDVVISIPGHGILVSNLAPFLDDIPVKGVRESIDSPDLIAVPVPGGMLSVPVPTPALWPEPGVPGLREQDVEEDLFGWSTVPIWRITSRARTAATSETSDDTSDSFCSAEGACLTHQASGGGICVAELPAFPVVHVTAFDAVNGSHLIVNGNRYSGKVLENTTFVLWSDIVWGGAGHFQICMEAPPLCPDGFELTPVSVEECPAGAELLSKCEEAEPGELCEGDGQCGTRTDINNCYDSGYTYPASRDVYRKQNFTRNESKATIAAPFTTTTTTFSFTEISLEEEQVDGPWRFQGPCVVDGGCFSSPRGPDRYVYVYGYGEGYSFSGSYGENETCVASLPPFTALTVEEFDTEKFYDQLTVNGIRYSGEGLQGESFVLWSNITWNSDESNDWSSGIGGYWKLCLDTPPMCSDGLVLTPVSVPDCPAATERLRDCQRAEPGELCEGDGQCGTRSDINNCYDSNYTYPASRDVYRKHNGTAVSWIVDGPCSVVDGCVQNLGGYESGKESGRQECNMSLTEATYVTVRQFKTSGGLLQINGRRYLIYDHYDQDSIFVNSSIRWTSEPKCQSWSSESGCLSWSEEKLLICIGKHEQLSEDTSDRGDISTGGSAGDQVAGVTLLFVVLFGSCCAGCTVVIVTICCCECCCKEKDQEGPEASPSPSRQLEDGVLPVLPSLPREREHSEPPELPVTKQLLGISAAYVLEIFPALARQSTGLENPNFYEMAPVVAMGESGLGYGKTCSEDGEPNCSIVDAVEEHHKGKVTYFVSCCWACRLNDFVGALRAWMEGHRINAREAYLWICFFCNNQYRLPKSGTFFSSAHELQTVLESRLAKAGQMLFVVDAETTCTKRAWCLFEVFTCVDKQLPITIMLPATREGLQEAFSTIDLRTARATSKADEDMINEVVLASAGFDAANARVRDCLLECLKH